MLSNYFNLSDILFLTIRSMSGVVFPILLPEAIIPVIILYLSRCFVQVFFNQWCRVEPYSVDLSRLEWILRGITKNTRKHKGETRGKQGESRNRQGINHTSARSPNTKSNTWSTINKGKDTREPFFSVRRSWWSSLERGLESAWGIFSEEVLSSEEKYPSGWARLSHKIWAKPMLNLIRS